MNENTVSQIGQSEVPVLEQDHIYRLSPYQFNLTAPVANISQIVGVTMVVGEDVSIIHPSQALDEPVNS